MELNRPDWRDPLQDRGPSGVPVRILRLRLSDLDGDPLETLQPLTVPSEHDRARRFRFDADRHRHLAGRGLIRAFLAHRYGGAPRDFSIVEGPNEKPRLSGPYGEESALEFNISHAADTIVVAISRALPVGIDIEPRDRDADLEGLAQRVMTESELEHWRALPEADRSDFFLHLWTCKEAFLKATGKGLRRSPRTINCVFEGDTAVGLADTKGSSPASPEGSASQWSLHPFLASEGIVGAVVRREALPSLAFTDAGSLLRLGDSDRGSPSGDPRSQSE